MAIPQIRSVGSSSGTVNNLGRNNLVIAETVTLSDTNSANSGHPHSWAMVDKPIGSSSTLTTPSAATSTFSPDVTGTYFIRCTVDGVSVREVLIAVPLARSGGRIPAFEEALQYDGGSNTKGWHEALTAALRALDTTFVGVGGQIGGTATAPTVLGIRETSGPTLLTFGSITNGQVLVRSGSTVVGTTTVASATTATTAASATFATTAGGAPPTGAASGQLGGTFPGPDVRGIRETAGPTLLTFGSIVDGELLKRVGSTVVSIAMPTGLPPSGSASGDLAGTFPSPTVAAIHETAGPTKLTIGSIVDGELLKRVGATLVSIAMPTALPPSGSASGDLSGSFPSPNVAAIHEASGPTKLTIGTIADGEFLKRVGTTLVSAAISVQAYATVQANAVSLTQRSTLNFSTDLTAVDNSGSSRTDVSLKTLSPDPTGTYSLATVTVDSKGRVTSASSGGATTVPVIWLSFPDMNAVMLPTNHGGSQNVGVIYYVLNRSLTCTGARFYWKRNATDRTIRCYLWDITNADGFSAGTLITSVDVAVTASGVYTGTWSGSQTLTANKRYLVSMWDISGSEYTTLSGITANNAIIDKGIPPTPFLVGQYLMVNRYDRFSGGNTFPGSGSAADLAPIMPIVSDI